MAKTQVTAPGIATDAVTVNKLPDTSITNAKLVNDSITINGTEVLLGGTIADVGTETYPTVTGVSPTVITNAQTTVTITGTSQSGQTYVAYCFANVQGYQKSGKYVGNGNADGTFVYTGFRPALVITKYVESGGTGGWNIQDDKRNTYNPVDTILSANTDGADSTSSGNAMDFLSNGFKWRANYSDGNTSGGFFSYAAFAEFPLVSSNDMPGVAR